MQYYYLNDKDQEVGPVDQDILIGRAQSGEITSTTLVRNSMVKAFKPASKVACLDGIVRDGTAKPGAPKKDSNIAKNLHRSESSIKAPQTNYRFMAFAFDLIIIVVLVVASFNIFKSIQGGMLDEEQAMSAFVASVLVIPMAYYSFALGLKAQTFGYWFFGIMVIKGKGEEVFVGRAFFMSFLFIVTLPLEPVLIYVFHKGLHEVLTGVRVVNVKLG